MILFISPYPSKANEQDGYFQRVAAIDAHFTGHHRVYFDIYLRCHLMPTRRKAADQVTVYQLNLFLHLPFILLYALLARMVYVHSVYSALRALPLYLFKRIITDMHGVVPEELAFAGDAGSSRLYARVEKFVVQHSSTLVCVTEAMADHLAQKYPGKLSGKQALLIPIIDPCPLPISSRQASEPYTVIYAGGLQKWQNVDMMLDAVGRAARRCNYVFLCGQAPELEKLVAARHLPTDITIARVPKNEVYGYYDRADFGFVLRDDIVVNRVACPTKLVEYMSMGVIPIVLQPLIGDFEKRGYSYLLLNDFIDGVFPTPEQIKHMRENNRRIIDELRARAASDLKRLSPTVNTFQQIPDA